MSETIYREDLKNETAIGWYESGQKAYETQYFMDEEVAVQEWTEAGEVVPAPLCRSGWCEPGRWERSSSSTKTALKTLYSSHLGSPIRWKAILGFTITLL